MSSESMEWYWAATADDSVNAVARKAGLVQTTLAAQVKKGELTPQSVVAVARAYEKDPLEALVAVGFLAPEEVDGYARRAALTDASDTELAREVWERMASGQATPPITDSRSETDRPASLQEIKQQRLQEQAQPAAGAADDRPLMESEEDWEPR